MAVVSAVVAVVGVVIEAVSAVNSNKRASDAAHQSRDAVAQKQAEQAGYKKQLDALMANPSAALNDPAAKGAAQSTSRQMAAMGYLGSGNMAAALQQSNLGYIQQQENFLAGMAGVNEPLNPLLNTNASISAYQNQIQQQGLAGIGYGVNKAVDAGNKAWGSSGVPGWDTYHSSMANVGSIDFNQSAANTDFISGAGMDTGTGP